MRNHAFIVGMLLLTGTWGIASSCSAPSNESGSDVEVAKEKLLKADQDFSINMFKAAVAMDGKENTFISPLSISTALGMTMNGAKGRTFEEMRQTLSFQDLEMQEINEGYASLIELLTSVDPEVKVEIANSVWSRQGFPVQDDFKNRLAEYFEAEARELDFRDPASVDVINGWVSDKTHDKIESILEFIPQGAMMYLINAVYFNGSWTYSFDPEATFERYFDLENGENVEVSMMNQKNRFSYLISDEVRIVDMPYGDGNFSMTMIMPASETPIDEFISKELTAGKINSWITNLITDTVSVVLPKLELTYDLTLNEPLISMGMETPFSGSADFSGINGAGGIFISRVLHKTYLKMDEEGTEAAGVTAVEISVTSVTEPQFPTIVFSKPYMFLIREQETGAILFIGKIKDPSLAVTN